MPYTFNPFTGNLDAVGSPPAVSSVFGRTGAITAVSGDYNTLLVTENTNLYFTNARAISALTGQSNTLFTNGAGYLTGTKADSVSNSDSTLTISPTTGAVVASLNLSHANTWAALQTFSTSNISITGGTSGQFLTTNGAGVNSWATVSSPTGANPTALVGLTAVNGSAVTFLRSDASPAIDQTIVPTWTGKHTFTATGTTPATVNSRTGHTNTATAPGDIISRLMENDSLGGRTSFLDLYHQYFPSQQIDISWFVMNNGFAGASQSLVGFGNLYGANFFGLVDTTLSFNSTTASLGSIGISTYPAAGTMRVSLNTGKNFIVVDGAALSSMNFVESGGFYVDTDYGSNKLLQTSATLGGTLLKPRTASDKALVVKGLASQTGDLTQWQNSAGTVYTKINKYGGLSIDNSNTIAQDVVSVSSAYNIGGSSALINANYSGSDGARAAIFTDSSFNDGTFKVVKSTAAYGANSGVNGFYVTATYLHTDAGFAPHMGKGALISVSNNNATSKILYGVDISATANTAGATALGALITASSTSGTAIALRLARDTSNYYDTRISTTGGVTFDAVGSGSAFQFNNKVTVPRGGASTFARVGGSIFDFFTNATVGGAEADIYTATTDASLLSTNGDKLFAEYGGNFVTVGTQLTQLKVYFGGTAIWDSTGVAPTTGTTSWRVVTEIIRVSATVVRYTVSLNTTGASGFVYCTSGELTGLTLTNTNILKITGTSSGVGSGSGDIVGKMGYINYQPYA